MLTDDEGRELLRIARRALEVHFGLASAAPGGAIATPPGTGGVFATLKRAGELRGCIGYIIPHVDLKTTTERAVVAAAGSDPRFSEVTADELPDIDISISVLTESVAVHDIDEIEIGRDGLVIERDGERGLLLPQVATERRWGRDRFLAETCVKAGLAPDAWQDPNTMIFRFAAAQFDEHSMNMRHEP